MNRCWLASLAMLGVTTPAMAGGYFYSDAGIVAAGRGGTFAAGGDTQFAQAHNPAALINVDAPQINVGWSGISQKTQFTADFGAAPDGSTAAPFGVQPAQTNGAPPFNVPQLGFATPIGDKFGFAFGLYSPYAPSQEWDPAGAQRYSIIDSAIYQFSVGPSVAFRPVEQVTVGVGLNYQAFWLQQSLALSLTGNPDPGGDITVDVRAADFANFGWNVGVLLQPVEQVKIGVGFFPSIKYKGKGSVLIDFEGNNLAGVLEQTTYQDGCQPGQSGACESQDGITLDIGLPTVIRSGVAVTPMDDFEIEVGYSYQNWKSMDDVVVADVDITVNAGALGEIPVDPPEFTIPQNLKDTHSIRLGAEYRFIDPLELRVGGFWENGAMTTQAINVSLPDSNKIQVGGGGTVYLLEDQFRIDFAAAGQFFQSQTITDSQVHATVVEVLPGTASELTVGNGTMKANGWLVGVQGRWAFMKGARDDG